MNEMTKMVGQMMCMPMTVFASSMEMLSRSMPGGGWPGMDCSDHSKRCLPCEPVPPVVREERKVAREERWCDDACGEGLECSPGHHHDGWKDHDRKERCGGCGNRSCDCCCGSSGGSDLVKLVEYSLVSVRRGRGPDDERGSRILASGEMLVTDCTDLEQLRYQIVADYAQRAKHPIDAKDLRVYVKVLDCWCKNDVDWCEEQVDALRSIAGSLRR